MICKIQPPNPNLEKAVEYNENKANGIPGIRDAEDRELEGIEDGHVLATRNVPDGMTLMEVLAERRLLAMKKKRSGPTLRAQTFHMSVNPSEDDRELSEKEAVAFIDELMKGLGYENQPYRIYKHTDIGRTHYHVVSCRIDENGKKVNDSFERLVLRENMKCLAEKYGYRVIYSEEERDDRKDIRHDETRMETTFAPDVQWQTVHTERREGKAPEKAEKKPVPPFSRKGGPLTEQVKETASDALKWHFSTFEQFQALMLRRYNVLVEVENGSEERLTFTGTDKTGAPVTAPIREDDLGSDFLARIREKISKEKMHNRKEQRRRLEKLASAAAEKAATYEEFRELMARKGVIVVVSFSQNGDPFGITYLDRATKCAWKGSETSADMKWLKATAGEKGWQITKDAHQSVIERRSKSPSRRRTITERTGTAATGTSRGTGRQTARTPGILDDYRGPGTANRTTGSSARAGDENEERRRDIDDDRPAELVH